MIPTLTKDQWLHDQASALLPACTDVLEPLRGAKLFITGGTGFIGRWLVEFLVLANERHELNLELTLLTRNAGAFLRVFPAGARARCLRFIEGDVRNFVADGARFTHVIHGAHTSALATFANEDPLIQFDTAFTGTRRMLEVARRSGAKRLLYLSSGSIYGSCTSGLIPEGYAPAPAPQDLGAALNHGKRASEFLCEYARQKHGLETVVARCFSFVGPGLPLDIHYAIGNFIRDALWSKAITIQGNGSPVRSYMYIADLIRWLAALLVQAPSGGVYNVGSDQAISIRQLAELVRDLLAPDKNVLVLGQPSQNAMRNVYVPDIRLACTTLDLNVWTPLDEAIRLTARHALLPKG